MKKQQENKEEHKHEEGKRYLKKYEIVETDVELPIQGGRYLPLNALTA